MTNPLNVNSPTSLPLAATQAKPLKEEQTLAHLPADIVDYLFRRYLTPQDFPSLRLTFKNSAPTFYSFLNQKKWDPCPAMRSPSDYLARQKKVSEFCKEAKNSLFLSNIHHLEMTGYSRSKNLIDCLSSMPNLKTLDLTASYLDLSADQIEKEELSLKEKAAVKELVALLSCESTAPLASQIENKKELNSLQLKLHGENKENIQILLDSIHVPFSLSLDASCKGHEICALLKEKKTLRQLTLDHDCQLTPADIYGILSDHPQLEMLSLSLNENFPMKEWPEDGLASSVKNLSLDFFGAIREGEEELKGFKSFLKANPQLQALKLSGIRFSDEEWLEILKEMDDLTSLAIPSQSSDVYVQTLATKKITQLELNHPFLSPELIAQLKSKELSSLTLNYGLNLTAENLKEMLQNQKKLSSLTLVGSELTSQELLAALSTEKLKFLKVDEAMADENLLQGLKNQPKLTSITVMKIERFENHSVLTEEIMPLERA